MMSEAEEMLLATRGMNNTSANKGSQLVDVPDDLEAPQSSVSLPQPDQIPIAVLKSAMGTHNSQSASSKLPATVMKQRHTRASTSDSRKGDLRVSSSIVAMSSSTVSQHKPQPLARV